MEGSTIGDRHDETRSFVYSHKDEICIANIRLLERSAWFFAVLFTYMKSNLNTGLIEAARIDGAGEIRIFNRIVLPLMRPAMAI